VRVWKHPLSLVSSFARADQRLASLLRAQREILLRLGRQDFYRLGARWLFGRWTQQDNHSLVDGFVRAAARVPTPQLERTFYWQVEAVCTYDSRPRLGQLRLPVQVVAGEEDLLTPLGMARELAGAIPGAALHVVPRAGHLLLIEKPEAVARLVSQFVADAETRRDSP
jgi:pimeloyl-ACP methyl ester carboxylesterase